MNFKAIGLSIVVVVAIVLAFFVLMSVASRRSPKLGLVDGKLRECPESPNCVSTQTQRRTHRMESIEIGEEDPLATIRETLDAMGGAKVVEESEDYLRAEFTTPLLRYVDDVEFLIDRKESQLHFRSASRVGYSDMGANRARMERFVQEYQELASGG